MVATYEVDLNELFIKFEEFAKFTISDFVRDMYKSRVQKSADQRKVMFYFIFVEIKQTLQQSNNCF